MTDFVYVQLGDGSPPAKAIVTAENDTDDGTLVDAFVVPSKAAPGGREVHGIPLADDHTGPDDDDTKDAHRHAQWAWPLDAGDGTETKKPRKTPAKKATPAPVA